MLSDEALLWRTRVGPCIQLPQFQFDCYKLTLSYESPRWLTKDGKLRKADASNMDKLCIDTLCGKWGWDDSLLTEVIRYKRYHEYERVVVTLEEGHRLER
jgi:Holliday junction resolvase RusA-like endonuclease